MGSLPPSWWWSWVTALINGERMPWEQVKRDGIDYIALYYVNEEGKQVRILDAELA